MKCKDCSNSTEEVGALRDDLCTVCIYFRWKRLQAENIKLHRLLRKSHSLILEIEGGKRNRANKLLYSIAQALKGGAE